MNHEQFITSYNLFISNYILSYASIFFFVCSVAAFVLMFSRQKNIINLILLMVGIALVRVSIYYQLVELSKNVCKNFVENESCAFDAISYKLTFSRNGKNILKNLRTKKIGFNDNKEKLDIFLISKEDQNLFLNQKINKAYYNINKKDAILQQVILFYKDEK